MSILEKARINHEDIELIELAASQLLLNQSRRVIDIPVDNAIDFLCRETATKTVGLMQIDSYPSDEHTNFDGASSSDIWHQFYSRIKRAKETARHEINNDMESRYPDTLYWYEIAMHHARTVCKNSPPAESNGKYVDMSSIHQIFLNMKRLRDYLVKSFVQTRWAKHLTNTQSSPDQITFHDFSAHESLKFRDMEYVSWLQCFFQLESIPRYIKYKQSDYSDYLRTCSGYIQGFIRRHRPLMDIEGMLAIRRIDFQDRWSKREVSGWDALTQEMPFYVTETDKLFTNENTLRSHIGSKDFAKNKQKFEGLTEEQRNSASQISEQADAEIAALEDEIRFLHGCLRSTFEETIDYITRKQARTAREIEAELRGIQDGEVPLASPEDESSAASSSGGEELDISDRAIYNPLNLPLGFDGKPIPYWMYKLHGLGHEFKCEICGNTSYWGRRAFDKHFSEWRHVNSLKALRIPNSSHFHGVTGIEDAIRLNDKMRKESASSIFNAEREMECEDAMGNVMPYRTYQDLMRQGML